MFQASRCDGGESSGPKGSCRRLDGLGESLPTSLPSSRRSFRMEHCAGLLRPISSKIDLDHAAAQTSIECPRRLASTLCSMSSFLQTRKCHWTGQIFCPSRWAEITATKPEHSSGRCMGLEWMGYAFADFAIRSGYESRGVLFVVLTSSNSTTG